jgi:hypothetical protein
MAVKMKEIKQMKTDRQNLCISAVSAAIKNSPVTGTSFSKPAQE